MLKERKKERDAKELKSTNLGDEESVGINASSENLKNTKKENMKKSNMKIEK